MLAGQRLPGHFTMPLIKQFCAIQTNRKYGQYSQDYRVLTQCQLELNQRHPIDAFNVLGYRYGGHITATVVPKNVDRADTLSHAIKLTPSVIAVR